jgi:hypothetical protein
LTEKKFLGDESWVWWACEEEVDDLENEEGMESEEHDGWCWEIWWGGCWVLKDGCRREVRGERRGRDGMEEEPMDN